MKIVCLLPHLRAGSARTRVLQLAGSPDLAEHEFQVVTLRGACEGTQSDRWPCPVTPQSSGVATDLAGVVRLRRLLRHERPELIQVCGLAALRRLYLAGGLRQAPVLLHDPLAPGRHPALSLVDRLLIRRCRRVVVPDDHAADRCRRAGIASPAIVVVPPAVATTPLTPDPSPSNGRGEKSTPLTPDASAPRGEREEIRPPVISCVGPLERHKGFYEAIWAFDVLRHLHRDLKLWIVGEGPDLPRLQRFTRTLNLEQSVRFCGECDDIRPLLQPAVAVWVPSLVDAGRHAVLEAMALGLPVVASALPGLTSLIADDVHGFLVPPGEKVMFAKKTKLLLDRPELGRQLGQAGRRRAANEFSVRRLTDQYRDLYRSAVAHASGGHRGGQMQQNPMRCHRMSA